MSDLLSSLSILLIVLIGLSVMIWGKSGPTKLMGAILAPFGCLLKLVAGFVIVGIGVVSFLTLQGERSHTGSGSVVESPPPSEPRAAAGSVLLAQYPMLDQRDMMIYEPPSLANEIDSSVNPPQPVRNLACLATVYVMLERGRGASDAMITRRSFTQDYYAINPGYVERADIGFNADRFINELRAGRPVVLHAEGGLLGHHFLLGVGIQRRPDGGWNGLANDPWFGRRIELDLGASAPPHPLLSDTTFTMMRLVN